MTQPIFNSKKLLSLYSIPKNDSAYNQFQKMTQPIFNFSYTRHFNLLISSSNKLKAFPKYMRTFPKYMKAFPKYMRTFPKYMRTFHCRDNRNFVKNILTIRY